jgi:alkaline phosphatase D
MLKISRTATCWLVFCGSIAIAEESANVIDLIAFGACVHQDKPAPAFDAIADLVPDLFVMLGDNIYGDTEDMAVLKEKYQRMAARSGFQRVRKVCPILATWDDHDYGLNDGGSGYAKRDESQQVFADIFELPEDSPVRRRSGVYDVYTYGPPEKRLQLILLDTRYFRSALKKRPEPGNLYDGSSGPYQPNPDPNATMLGETQWKWLAKQFRKPAKLRVVVSSIQVVSPHHGWEKWMNMPRETERLYGLIRDTRAGGVVFLSGDRHHAEISRNDDTGVGYPLYDITVGSMTHGRKWANEINPYRLGAMYNDENFGALTIDWLKPDPLISLQIRDPQGKLLLRHQFPLSSISPK